MRPESPLPLLAVRRMAASLEDSTRLLCVVPRHSTRLRSAVCLGCIAVWDALEQQARIQGMRIPCVARLRPLLVRLVR